MSRSWSSEKEFPYTEIIIYPISISRYELDKNKDKLIYLRFKYENIDDSLIFEEWFRESYGFEKFSYKINRQYMRKSDYKKLLRDLRECINRPKTGNVTGW